MPAGVKVFSAVFAVSARAAAELVDVFLEGCEVEEQEVLDIDKGAFQQNRLASKLYSFLSTPQASSILQLGKECS